MALDSTLNTVAGSSIFQQIQQNMPEWFQQGGVVMWLLLITSFLATIVTLERCFIWLNYHFKEEHFPLHDCFASLNKHERTDALLHCQKLDTPALKMLEHGINALPFSPNEKMESYAEIQISAMSRGQSLLDTVITLAPMLGILGTVLGIIDSFNSLSLQGAENLSAVVGGIAQALISTAAGLFVALLALLPYNLFRSQIQKLTLHLESVGSEFYHICHQKSLVTNQMSEIMQAQEDCLYGKPASKSKTDTVAEHSEMPYHYEFKEGSDEVKVSIHDDEMKELHKTSQESLAEMYSDAVNDKDEFFGVNEVELQELQETTHLKDQQRAGKEAR
ncbi:MotA/TolQ/ExbB proton channel family protein [Psychromonas ossibalaenae]|uniref:MotA/TolQ/ExbB proton channel family protein n=1 Tax=Psychromonas ossibalaenae TaxID=444922 RepID=UPI0003764C76|nr:MotA/TolQ/ExbB proton channel family protein [Psychromonas ossibalaenae]